MLFIDSIGHTILHIKFNFITLFTLYLYDIYIYYITVLSFPINISLLVSIYTHSASFTLPEYLMSYNHFCSIILYIHHFQLVIFHGLEQTVHQINLNHSQCYNIIALLIDCILCHLIYINQFDHCH